MEAPQALHQVFRARLLVVVRLVLQLNRELHRGRNLRGCTKRI